jgi:hypothetical protein
MIFPLFLTAPERAGVSVFFVIGVMLVLVVMHNTLGWGSPSCPFCGGKTKHEDDCWFGKEKK